ncbi:MAG TPA: ABC transporter ATP-binding protein [Actinocatenispora sp.]
MTLTLADVRLSYPDGDSRTVVLDRIGLAVGAGEMLAVTGPSGAGKSSLLAVAGALVTPEAGTVTVDGVPLGGLRPADRDRLRRSRIGFVFQWPNLLAAHSALDQLMLIAHINRLPGRPALDRARYLLDRVGLADKADRRPDELSGGERQRVGVARALMAEPALLLADEPTSALDDDRGAAVVALLRDVTHEHRVATVLTTHDTRYLPFADRAAEMHAGRLVDRAA